jgi:hypothetical protein
MKCIGIFATVIVSLSATAYAQQHPVWSSVDLLVAQADRVVIGRIAEMGEASGNAELNERRQPIVLAVEETLKGEPVSRLSFNAAPDLWSKLNHGKLLCGTCAEHSHRLLVMVGHRQNYPQNVNAIDLDASSVSDVTGDLRLLATGAAIVQAAREEVRRCPGVLDDKQVARWGPSDTLMNGMVFHSYEVYVPVDERQEKLAHKVLSTQPAPTEMSGYHTNDRWNAVKVLAFFRSPQNIKLLRSLLNDPQIEHAAIGSLDYPIRELAYRVLLQWGIDVPQPTRLKIQEPWDGKMPRN